MKTFGASDCTLRPNLLSPPSRTIEICGNLHKTMSLRGVYENSFILSNINNSPTTNRVCHAPLRFTLVWKFCVILCKLLLECVFSLRFDERNSSFFEAANQLLVSNSILGKNFDHNPVKINWQKNAEIKRNWNEKWNFEFVVSFQPPKTTRDRDQVIWNRIEVNMT